MAKLKKKEKAFTITEKRENIQRLLIYAVIIGIIYLLVVSY